MTAQPVFKDYFPYSWQEEGIPLFLKGQQEVAASLFLLVGDAWRRLSPLEAERSSADI